MSRFLIPFFGPLLIPYVIICKSCSAKLKVSVPDLIDQTIDCPKCNTELTLTPPPGYENPLTDSTGPSEATTTSFDDLDDLLGEAQGSSVSTESSSSKRATAPKAPASQKRTKKQPAAKPARQPKESAELVAPVGVQGKSPQGIPEPKLKRQQSKQQPLETDARDPVTLDSPMLPDGSWDSDALKKRKRLLQYGALGVLGVVLAAVGVSFLAGGSGVDPKPRLLKESPTVEKQDESSSRRQQETVKLEPDSDAVQDSRDNTATPQTASVTDLDGGDAIVRSAADFTAPAIGDTGFQTPTEKQPTTPLPSLRPSAKPETPAAMPQVDNTVNATKPEDGRVDSFVKKAPKESPLVSNRQSLSEFARALEDAGTVLSEIKDQALLQRESALIGLPKYFVEPLDEDPVDVAKQLGVSVSGVQFTDLPLLDVLFELESLSGLPVSFDWEAGEIRATDFLQKISLTTKNEKIESLFATVADKVKLTVVAHDRGLTLTRSQPAEAAAHIWKLSPPLSDASVGELKGFIVRTWPLEATDAQEDEAAARKELAEAVSVTSNQVTLSCDADMRSRVDRWIAGMTAAADPQSAQLTIADVAVTPTVFRIDPILERPLNLAKDNPFNRPYRIGSLLRQIRRQAGLNIFMDWPSFQTQGWTPNTHIPGNFNEATCRDALEQLARSLKASWTVIDEKTVLVTSFEATRARSETEVYPVKFLLQKNLTAGELKRVLEDTLRQQLQMPGVSVVYFGECDCLVAHAPQAVHRQLYSILNRLWQDLK